MKKYDKLVRDLIPEIIEKAGQTSKTRIVTGKEKTKYLETKLEEVR
ncbi:MAG: hypothetical protein ACRDAU_06920 [Clostridium sp.]